MIYDVFWSAKLYRQKETKKLWRNYVYFVDITVPADGPALWGARTSVDIMMTKQYTGLILGLHPANERRRYKVRLIGWAQT